MKSQATTSNCGDQCPIKITSEIIEGKWTTLILRELLKEKKRYSDIQHALFGISPKILAQRLRFLEQHRLVIKTIYATIPPSTEYELTPLGRKAQELLLAMKNFGEAINQSATTDFQNPINKAS